MSDDFLNAQGPLTRRAALQILLEECYRDGKIDPTRDGTLAGLARSIGVEARLSRRIARSARRRASVGDLGPRAPFDPQRVYDRAEVLAYVDGELLDREIAILERLRKVMRLPPLHPELDPNPDPEITPRYILPATPDGAKDAAAPPPPRLKPSTKKPAPKPPRPAAPEQVEQVAPPPAAPGRVEQVARPPSPAAPVAPAPAAIAPPAPPPAPAPPAPAPPPGPAIPEWTVPLVGPLAPLARVPALAEAGQLEDLARTLIHVVSTASGDLLERAYRHALAAALTRVESRPELDDASRLVGVARQLAADATQGAQELWDAYARAACRLARELGRRGEWDRHAALAAQLEATPTDESGAVVSHQARLLRDALQRRFEARQSERAWALVRALEVLHASQPASEGAARELGLALARALASPDALDRLAPEDQLPAARLLTDLAKRMPWDLALARKAVAAGPVVAPILMEHGGPGAVGEYLTDLMTLAEYWPGHEPIYGGIARACEKALVLCHLNRPDDQRTPELGLAVLKTLRRAAPASVGIADAMVMVAAQTGIAIDVVPGGGGAAPLHRLHEDVRALWQAGEELAALPDDAEIRARIDQKLVAANARVTRACTGEPLSARDAKFVLDLIHEVERQTERCLGTYWPSRHDWFQQVVTGLGENGEARLARMAASVCERMCWPEPL